MKLKSLIFFFMVLLTNISTSQTYEIGISTGGTNFVGDVGSESFTSPNDYISRDQLSGGFLFRWNRSDRHSFRFTAMRFRTSGYDSNADDRARSSRGLSFTTDITEFSVGIEFTFWEFDLHEFGNPFVPYLYTGPAYFLSNHQQLENDELVEGDTLSSFAIPMVLGIKYRFAFHWLISAEFGARYTFTDNLDGSTPSETDSELEDQDFGNLNSNDWYLYSGITLTYTFGRKPCYCKF